MTDTMTLEQVRDWHLDRTNYVHLPITNATHKELAEGIDAALKARDAAVPVGRLNIRRFRGSDAMVNHDFDYCGDLPDGTYSLYAVPPAQAKGATHCDNCGCTWLDDGLNPVGCPYCKPAQPAQGEPVPEQPARRRGKIMSEAIVSPRRRYAIFSSLLHGNYAIVVREDDIERATQWGNFVAWLGAEKPAEIREVRVAS